MAGEKYPTLSSSLRVYAMTIDYLNKLKADPDVKKSQALQNGVQACQNKFYKFFDLSTFDSEYYYFATSEYYLYFTRVALC